MPYVTTVERRGIEKGIEQGIEQGTLAALRNSVLQVLEVRFSPLPDSLMERIRMISDVDRLEQLLRKAVVVDAWQDLGL
jgi:hypothetical protein